MTRFGKRKFVGSNGVFMPSKCKESFRFIGMKFVYIGRLEMHIKGLDLMLNAVKEKAEFLRQNRCTLDIYGPDILGRAAAVAELIEQNGIGDIVTLHPPISGEEKEKALLDADVFIQTSRSEGMPMGILEALGYGLPCLVTEGTTLADFVNEKDIGWGCGVSVAQIAEALEQVILQRDGIAGKSSRAVLAILQNFAWDVVANASVSQYQKITQK
jgi:glycosyltransferase involved in cell wall biosynthesis